MTVDGDGIHPESRRIAPIGTSLRPGSCDERLEVGVTDVGWHPDIDIGPFQGIA
jgi:hypothetical protein